MSSYLLAPREDRRAEACATHSQLATTTPASRSRPAAGRPLYDDSAPGIVPPRPRARIARGSDRPRGRRRRLPCVGLDQHHRRSPSSYPRLYEGARDLLPGAADLTVRHPRLAVPRPACRRPSWRQAGLVAGHGNRSVHLADAVGAQDRRSRCLIDLRRRPRRAARASLTLPNSDDSLARLPPNPAERPRPLDAPATSPGRARRIHAATWLSVEFADGSPWTSPAMTPKRLGGIQESRREGWRRSMHAYRTDAQALLHWPRPSCDAVPPVHEP